MTSPSFPVSLDALANPGPTTETDDLGFELDIVVARLQNCVMAIEQKLGIGAGAPPASAAVLRRTAAGASAWGQIATADMAAAQVTTPLLATGAAGGFKGLQYFTTQSVASTVYVGMAGSSLTVVATGAPILFGVTLLDLGSSAAATFGVQIWDQPSTPIAQLTNENVSAGLYKATTTLALINVAAGTHNYLLVWKATAGTMQCNGICFWALEMKTPLQG